MSTKRTKPPFAAARGSAAGGGDVLAGPFRCEACGKFVAMEDSFCGFDLMIVCEPCHDALSEEGGGDGSGGPQPNDGAQRQIRAEGTP